MRFVFSFFYILLVFVSQVWAKDFSQVFHDRYEAIASFQADCTQILTNAGSGEVESRKGRILFKKPGLVRWENMDKTDGELFIVGKNSIWDYFPQDKIVYVGKSKDAFASKNMLRFLIGGTFLSEDFTLENQGKEDGFVKMKLVPKNPDPELVLAWLWWNEKTQLAERLLIIDFFGNGNEMRLSDIELDISLAPSLFEFIPPKDVSVEPITE